VSQSFIWRVIDAQVTYLSSSSADSLVDTSHGCQTSHSAA
jgi:hypothetical protein